MRRMFSLEQLKGIADNRVQTLVEGGTLDNAKPIYYHPINVLGQLGGEACRFTLAILNNSSSPINTGSLLKTALKTLMDSGANIQSNGYYVDNSVYMNIFIMTKTAEDTYSILANSASDYKSDKTIDDVTYTFVTDGVNKLN